MASLPSQGRDGFARGSLSADSPSAGRAGQALGKVPFSFVTHTRLAHPEHSQATLFWASKRKVRGVKRE